MQRRLTGLGFGTKVNGWLDEPTYADIVALCQFLPGPASSQVGIAIGMLRAGLPGAFCAWLGFTTPSALALIVVAINIVAARRALRTAQREATAHRHPHRVAYVQAH